MTAVEEILALARQDPDVLAVLLYGSQARGDAGPRSDVDLCLVLDPAFSPEAVPAKGATYLHPDLDVRIFTALPLAVRRRVLREGKILYARDEDSLYDLAIRTAKEWEDFRHVYEDYLEAVAHGP